MFRCCFVLKFLALACIISCSLSQLFSCHITIICWNRYGCNHCIQGYFHTGSIRSQIITSKVRNLIVTVHVGHCQRAGSSAEICHCQDYLCIIGRTIGLDTGTRMDEGNLLSCKSIHVKICKYIYIYQHRQRGPTVFLEVDIFKGSHYGNPYSQGHTNC